MSASPCWPSPVHPGGGGGEGGVMVRVRGGRRRETEDKMERKLFQGLVNEDSLASVQQLLKSFAHSNNPTLLGCQHPDTKIIVFYIPDSTTFSELDLLRGFSTWSLGRECAE